MMRLLTYLFAVAFTGMGFTSWSQNETKKWYFGRYAALDFTTNPPTNITNSAMVTERGCSSIADAYGNLLFYTNGAKVWNSSNAVMANGTGLSGHEVSDQSALIVKQPGNASIYFIFTTDLGTNGLMYSMVDMSLAAGMGSVTAKNVPVYSTSARKLCAAKHCNGTDVWIVSHERNTDVFRSYLLTAGGVNASAVTSSVGSVMSGNTNAAGCMKISPNGKKLAAAFSSPASFELYDFNASTGAVSNPLSLPTASAAYGCEFSPDGTKLYGSATDLYQWNLCAGSGQAIAASATTLTATYARQLQLGPDGKIYVARAQLKRVKVGENIYITAVYGEPALGVIHQPNNSVPSVIYNNTGFFLSPSQSMYGLPNFVAGFYKTPSAQFTYTIDPAISCVKAFFTAPPLINATCSATSYTISSVKWLFDDAASGAANTSVLLNPDHSYPTIGTYNVRLVLYNDCGGVIDTVRQQVVVGGALTNAPSTYSLCAGQSLTLSSPAASTYSWSTGATSSSIVVTPTVNTTYTVENTDASGCPHKSVQTVTVYPRPPITVTGNTVVCAGTNLTLTAHSGVTYSWSTGSTNTGIILQPSVTTVYTLSGTSFVGCRMDTSITVTIKPNPPVSITGNTVVCVGSTTTLTASGSANYVWSDGTTGPTATLIPNPNINAFSVKATYTSGCVRAKGVFFRFKRLPLVTVAGTPTVCAGAIVTQTAGGAVTYTWSNGSTANPAQLIPFENTTFTVSGADTNHCVNTATVLISVKPSATMSINNATICAGKPVTLRIESPIFAGASYLWLPDVVGGDSLVVAPAASSIYTVVSSLNGCVNTATSNVLVLPTPSLVTDTDMKILPGASVPLHVSGGVTYTWTPADYLSCGDCDSPTASPPESTRYCVSSSIGECVSEACITITVSCETDHDLSVPNAFTPNGDGRNDEFCLQGWDECITDFNVMIFDRWGEKVYESGNPSFCWDGSYKGKPMNSGVFIYVIHAKKLTTREFITVKGNITLIR